MGNYRPAHGHCSVFLYSGILHGLSIECNRADTCGIIVLLSHESSANCKFLWLKLTASFDGDSVTLSGIGGLSKCEWTFNKTLIASHDNSGLNSSRYVLNSTECSLTIRNVSAADNGRYNLKGNRRAIIEKKDVFLHVQLVTDTDTCSALACTCVSEIVVIVLMLLWLMCVVIDVCFHSVVVTMYVKLRDRIFGVRGRYDLERARNAAQSCDNAY